MTEEHKQHLSDTWSMARRRKRAREMKEFWDKHRDELVIANRETDNRKHIDLKEYKQTEFGTGERDREGYRDYQREVQRKYRADKNSKTMQYFREYARKKHAKIREDKIALIQSNLDVPSHVVGKYVVTADGRFFKISTCQQSFPAYIAVDGVLIPSLKVMELYFGCETEVDIDPSVDGIGYDHVSDEMFNRIVEEYYGTSLQE